MSIGLIGVEVGVLLNSEDEEFEAYRINNPKLPYGFYDENQYIEKESSLKKVRKEVLSYVKNGVEGTYGIISQQFSARDEEECNEFISGNSEYQFDYTFFRNKKDILYSVCKKDGKIFEGFLEVLIDDTKYKINGRVAFGLNVSGKQLDVLTGKDREAATKLFAELLVSDALEIGGDSYLPIDWNEELANRLASDKLSDLDVEDLFSFCVPDFNLKAMLLKSFAKELKDVFIAVDGTFECSDIEDIIDDFVKTKTQER